jgi:drug/metabolite transporter (DMT)-like permease
MGVNLAAAVTIGLWASAFAAIRAVVAEMPPGELAFMRYSVASVGMVAIMLASKSALPPRSAWPRIAAAGLTGIAGYNLALNYGEQTVTAGAASLLAATKPLITGGLAVAFLGELINRRLFAGLALGFLGAVLIAIGEGDAGALDTGALFVVLASCGLAVSFVIQKPVVTKYGAIAVTAGAIWVATLALSPFAMSSLAAAYAARPETLVIVAYLGVGPGLTAYALWAYVLSRTPVSRAATYLYASPVVAIAIAAIWLGEVPGPIVVVGGILALVGVVIGAAPGSVGSGRFGPIRVATLRARAPTRPQERPATGSPQRRSRPR